MSIRDLRILYLDPFATYRVDPDDQTPPGLSDLLSAQHLLFTAFQLIPTPAELDQTLLQVASKSLAIPRERLRRQSDGIRRPLLLQFGSLKSDLCRFAKSIYGA